MLPPADPNGGSRYSPEIRDRARGALLGLAVGDALGTTLEFEPRDNRPRHTEMTGGGPFDLVAGQWTDDTAMALALADSLTTCGNFDAHDLMDCFVDWWRHGRCSCTGTCFDIGITTREALARFEQTDQPFAGSIDPHAAGNGSLMRLAPVALFTLDDADAADRLARDQSRITHAAAEAVDACGYFVQLLRLAVLGGTDTLRALPFAGSETDRLRAPVRIEALNDDITCHWTGEPKIRAISAGSWRGKTRREIRSSGYVIDTLEAALWSVGTTSSFEEALILAVNLGQDADTIGAVTGQLAGAIYGTSAIPSRWLEPLAWRDRIRIAADALIV